MSKNAKDLIAEKVQEMGPNGFDSMQEEYKYTCMDTGLMFEAYGQVPMYSPYTGSSNIMAEEPGDTPMASGYESVNPGEYMKSTGVPSNQADPKKQNPLSPNPVPAPGPTDQNTPWAGNPAPDASGTIGAIQADGRGFVPYPQSSAPSSTTTAKNSSAGSKTGQ